MYFPILEAEYQRGISPNKNSLNQNKGSETIILSRTDFLITTVKVITILGYLIISSHERLQPISTFLFSILSWVNFPVDWLKHKQFECDITYSSCFSNQSTCFVILADQSSNRHLRKMLYTFHAYVRLLFYLMNHSVLSIDFLFHK